MEKIDRYYLTLSITIIIYATIVMLKIDNTKIQIKKLENKIDKIEVIQYEN